MIRNIVFDMGNVMVRFDPELFMTRARVTDPEEREMIRRELFHSLEWSQMDLGVLEEKTAEPLVLRRIPEKLHDSVRELLYCWSSPEDVLPGIEELVIRLKAAGYGIYLLSNASVAQHHYWPKYPVSRYFDGVMISADWKVVKPMREIYQCFTDKFSLCPSECVFVDDIPMNVAGAVLNGWQGIVFHGDARELERKLADLGVKI